MVFGPRGESPYGKKSRKPCKKKCKGKFTDPSCDCWHPPVCLDTLRLTGSPVKSRRIVVERISCLIGGVQTVGLCVSRFSSEKIHSTEKWENCDPTRPSNSPRARGTTKHSGKKGSIARREAWDLAKNVYKLKNKDQATFYSPTEARHFISRGTRIRGRFWSINVHAEQKGFRLKRTGDPSKTLNTTTVVTTNGEVQTNEEAQEYVHDLDLFVTVQLLEDTLAVLSLASSAKSTGIHMSGPVVKSHI